MYLSGAGLTKATFRFHFIQAQAQQVSIWRFVTIHQHKVGIENEDELRGASSAARVRRKVEMRQDFGRPMRLRINTCPDTPAYTNRFDHVDISVNIRFQTFLK